MCCFQRSQKYNILKDSLESIWFGKEYKNARKMTEKGKLPPVCVASTTCPVLNASPVPVEEVAEWPYPRQFEIDLPMQHCNYGGDNPNPDHPACFMCERNLAFRVQEDKVKEICEKLYDYVRYAQAIHIQGVAEPFWKGKIFEVAEWLGWERFAKRLRISTTTNGSLMGKKTRERWLSSFPKSVITWSLDASTPEVYQKVRNYNFYKMIRENIIAYGKERTPDQMLQIHNNINLINIGDVEGMVELAKEAGVDRLDFNATYSVPGVCVNAENAHLFREAQQKICIKAAELGVNVTFMRNLYLWY